MPNSFPSLTATIIPFPSQSNTPNLTQIPTPQPTIAPKPTKNPSPTPSSNPTPEPTPKPDVENFGWTPYNWGFYNTNISNDVFYPPSTAQQITHVDTSVYHGTQGVGSIRIDGPATTDNVCRELDYSGNETYHIAVSAGDVVTFGAWIKCDPSTNGNTKGAIIGFDMYYDNFRVWEVCIGTKTDYSVTDPPFTYSVDYIWAPCDSDWTYYEFSWTIPAHAFTTDDFGISLGGSYYINYIIPWLCGWWLDPTEQASVWFDDMYLTIVHP